MSDVTGDSAAVEKTAAAEAALIAEAVVDEPCRLAMTALGRRIGRGRTAEVYAFGDDRVVKLFHQDRPRARAEREFVRTRAALDAGAPAWRVDALVEVEGRWGVLGEQVAGTRLDRLLLRRPDLALALVDRLAELQAELAGLRVAALPGLKQETRAAVRAARLPPVLRRALLEHLAAMPGGRTLCHGDLHLRNVVCLGPPLEGRLVVLDWHLAARGDPAADVARARLLLHAGSRFPRLLHRRFERLAGPLAERFLRRRLALAGAPTRAAVAAWWPLALVARLARRDDPARPALLRQLERSLA